MLILHRGQERISNRPASAAGQWPGKSAPEDIYFIKAMFLHYGLFAFLAPFSCQSPQQIPSRHPINEKTHAESARALVFQLLFFIEILEIVKAGYFEILGRLNYGFFHHLLEI